MEIFVRPYVPADIPAMTDIWNQVVRAGQSFPQEEEETGSGAFFASQSHCGVATDASGTIMGMYILHPNNIGRVGHICNASYAVAEGARGHGIGAVLVRDSLRMAKKLGYGIMQFNAVTADNGPANHLYQKLGFKSLGQIPEGFRRPNGEMVPINLYYFELKNVNDE